MACGTDNISITYDKTGFNKGELHPEHYFDCENLVTGAEYTNQNVTQSIEYRVNFNQSLQVNVEASNVFDHSIGRDTDELAKALSELIAIQKTTEEIKNMLKDPQYAGQEEYLNSMLEAAGKEHTYREDNFKNLAASLLTSFEEYGDKIMKTTTDLASRQSRLNLTSERVTSSLSNMKGLASENIGIELSDIIIQEENAALAYNASLKATGSIMGMSLLDFI